MISKKYIIVFVFIFSITKIHAQESKFCSKTLNMICKESKGQRKETDKYLNGLKKEIAKELKKKSDKPNTKVELGRSIVNNMFALIANPKSVSMFKNYMYQAVDESNFDESIRLKFKKTIESVRVANYSEFYESDEELYRVLRGRAAGNCGTEGMDINAFSTTINNEKFVFFCPGFLISLSQIKNEQERLNAFLQMMSHEMGHHIDTKLVGEKIYLPYLSCLSENYSDQLKKTNSDKEFCKKQAKSQAECNMQTIRSHAKELIADQWAIKVLAIHARDQNYSMTQSERLLQSNFINICDTLTEGIHPTGDFRIEALLRANPDISDNLSCNNSEIKRPACTFDGAINL